MPVTYTKQPREIVASTAEALKTASEQLMQVAAAMEASGLEQGYFRWTQRQWDCLDVVTELCSQSVAMMPHQVLAKAQNRPCCYEIIQQRSARDVAARKLRTPQTEPKKRGRPRLETVQS